MKKMITMLLMLAVTPLLFGVTVYIPKVTNDHPGEFSSSYWRKFEKVEKWVVKNNGTIEFFHDGKFYVSSDFIVED